MPKISQITTASAPSLSDKLIGTSVGGFPNNQTNNFTLQEIKTLFDGGSPAPSPTLQSVLNAGNTAIQNIYLTGRIEAIDSTIANNASSKNLYLSERFFDRNNSAGTNGQYLTSTGSGVQWSTLTIPIPTLQQVLTSGNVSDKDITTTGNIQGANIQGTNITANSNLRVVGTLSDSTNSVGGSGQVLSSTGTGTDWVDLPAYSAVSPLIYNNISRQFSIQQATSTQNGYLSSADWITFDGKQNAGNYITALTGEASALGPGSVSITLNNLAVINKTLTGFTALSGTVNAADSIISAFGKIQGQINGIVAGVVYQGTWNAATNTPTLTSSVGVKGNYYVVDVAGNTNLNGVTDWQVGDWAIYNGTAWQKVDNTDAVTSVNGQIGAVVLNTDNINEGTTNLYYTNTRARNAISSLATGLTYTASTGVFSLTSGYSIPTIANQTDWTTAYNNSIVSAAVTGTTTKTLTLTQQDGGTITANWTDLEGLTSVGLSVPSAFNVSNSPLTSNGTISITGAGNSLQYIDGTGSLQTFPSLTGFVPYIGATQAVALGYNSLSASNLLVNGPSSTQGGYLGLKQSTNVVTGSLSYTSIYALGQTYLGFVFPQTPSGYKEFSFNVSGITNNVPGGRIYNMPDASGTLALTSDIPVGGLTSVGLSMPAAFTVSNSPLTTNGTINVTGAGTTSQYVRGDGSLAAFPPPSVGGGGVSYYLNGGTNQGTIGGNVYEEMSKTPVIATGVDFTINANGYIANFITDAGDPSLLNIPAGNWNFQLFFSASSGGGTPEFYVELYKYNGTTLTLIAQNSANPEVITGGTSINAYVLPLAVPDTTLTITDRLAIRIYVTHDGKTITLHTQGTHLCQIATTFSTGISALNGLTDQVQYFATGTSGSDFNINSVGDTHTFNLPTASSSNRGALSSTDWVTFNNKQNLLTLTTSGASGASTLVGSTLNVPTYTISGLGGVPTSRQLTINGTQYDLSADRNWSVGTVTSVSALTLGTSGTDLSSSVATGTTTPVITLNVPTASASNRGALSSSDWNTFNTKVGSVTASSPLGSSGGSTPNITIQQANGSQNGFLSSADWTTFNNKQASGNYITSLTGEVTALGPGAASATLNNASVTSKILTGVNITGGSIAATDSMLTAFGKLQNQINSLIGGSIYQGTWNASTNTPTLTSSVGTSGYYYIVNVAGSTNLNGITDWKVGDWAIFHGGTWQKVDNTDAVTSVNGQVGAVSLTTDNISEGSTNLYYLNSRARAALSFSAGSGAYNSTTGVITIPTNTNQLTNGSNYITLGSLSGVAPISYNSGTGAISIAQSSSSVSGFLSSSDWNTFNNKANASGSNASGTWPISISGNAETVDGYSASTSTLGNHIVVRDGNGYIFGNYINMTDDGNPGGGTSISSFITKQGDNYYRSVSPTNAMSSIRGVASGTWGINVTGSADSATFLNTQFLGTGSINTASGRSTVLRNENGAGAVYNYSPTLHVAASDTMWQIQGSYGTSGNGSIFFRQGYAGSWGNWLNIITSANISSQTVSYAYSAGSAQFASSISIANSAPSGDFGLLFNYYGNVYNNAGGLTYTPNVSTLNIFSYSPDYGTNFILESGRITYGLYGTSSVGYKASNPAYGDYGYFTPYVIQFYTSSGDNGSLSNYGVYFNSASQSGGSASYTKTGASAYGGSGTWQINESSIQSYSYFTGEGFEYSAWSSGNLYIGGILYQNWFSDAKYKDNVVEIESALDKVKSIRGVEYDWNELALKETGREGHDVGVIAQEVQSVYPFAVREVDKEKDDHVQTALVVDYEKLIPLLLQSIRELSVEVDSLKDKLKNLQ